MPSSASAAPEVHRELTYRLRERLDSAIGALLAGHSEVALVTFPNHWNIGDTAIWAGQRAVLDRLGIRVPYVCDFRSYGRDELRKAVPEGPILLSGGGNFGDVYPNEQGLRERVLEDFPERPIIQLSQSVWFRSEAAMDDMRRRCERSGRFVLIVRDRRSFELARARFCVPVHLLPDMAFALPDLRHRREAPTADVLWLLRRDIEAADVAVRRTFASDRPGTVRDWTRPGTGLGPGTWAEVAQALWRSWLLLRMPRGVLRGHQAWVQRSFEALARLRMGIGCRLLSVGRILVTDRLHGHVLALLLGIPHVCLDNRNGKVRDFYMTWTASHPLVRWADSPDEARALARELLCRPGGVPSEDHP